MKPGPASWMAGRIETVGELRQLLANTTDDTPLVVCPVADHNGWTNLILNQLGTTSDIPGAVVLALAEETTQESGEDTAIIKFPIRPV